MKRNLFIFLTCVIILLLFILLANVMTLGDRLMGMHVVVGYIYYLFILVLLGYGIFLPVVRILNTPRTPALDVKSLPVDGDALYSLGLQIAANSRHIENTADRKKHREALTVKLKHSKNDSSQLTDVITAEINHRMKKIDSEIRGKALSVFLITALSQNGKFDFITSLIANIKMVHRIVELSGFRPSYTQLLRLYFEVLLASFITDFSEDFLTEIDFSALLGSVKIPAIMISSVLDGSMTALMTLRIGYITKAYIQRGEMNPMEVKQNRDFRKLARRKAIQASLKTFPDVAGEGLKQLKTTSVKALGGWLKNTFNGNIFRSGKAKDDMDTKGFEQDDE